MHAIIIAAGLGSRMKELTKNKPKSMLDFNGKALLQLQIDILRKHNITDISVITGYLADKVNIENINYYYNDNYQNNNILESLFYAEEKITGDVIISYCDIYYEENIISNLLTQKHNISLVVDSNWQENYIGRTMHPISEAENVYFDKNNKISKIGKIIKDKEVNIPPGEFIGMLKLNNEGCDILKKYYHLSKEKYSGKKFQKADIFEKAYITDITQEMIDNGEEIYANLINGNWHEIDTQEDYYKILSKLKIIVKV